MDTLKTCRKTNYSSAETSFSCQDPNDMYDITGCNLF